MEDNTTDIGKQAAETIEKLSAHIQKISHEREVFQKAFEDAVTKLARYEHLEDCRKMASVLLEKGCIAEEDYSEKVASLYKMKVSELEGMKNAVQFMRNPVPAWGVLEGHGTVLEGSVKTSADYLEDLTELLESKR